MLLISKSYIFPLMPAKPLTPQELQEAAKLKALFFDWQKRRKDAMEVGSQDFATSILGFNQSALSQYINGSIPLNINAAVKFASLIGCKISQFSPTIAAQIIEAMSYVGDLPGGTSWDDATLHMLKPVEVHIITRYRLTDDAGRGDILDVVSTVPVLLAPK